MIGKETRGGSRPGCGRKPVHPGIKRVQTTISVSQKTRERIRILAKNKNIRIGRVIDRVVEELYNKHCNDKVDAVVKMLSYDEQKEQDDAGPMTDGKQ